MRRSELESNNPGEIRELFDEVEIGYLGLVIPDGFPRVIPLNFVVFEDNVYFHGAAEGEKLTLFEESPKVTFSVDRCYAIIPSYWLAKGYACPATTFYKSICIKGVGQIVTNLEEKAISLQKFMEKYQPEGDFVPITTDNKLYEKPLREVAVFRIDRKSVEFKKQFGQSHSGKTRLGLAEKLWERNQGYDRLAAREIRKMVSKNCSEAP